MMLSRGDLFLVTREHTVVSAVSSALSVNGEWSERSVCRTVHDLGSMLQRAPRAAVVVDIDPTPEQSLSELDFVTRRFGEARFIVVSSAFNSDLVLQAMQAGARHFMLKASITAELMSVIRRLGLDQPRISLRRGCSIAFLSASGGCGTTTLGINLAAELHQLSSEPVLMIDLDEHYGSLGSYLGVQGQYGIADVLSHPGHIDPQLVTSTAEAYSQGLHVLLSPAGTQSTRKSEASGLALHRLDAVVDATKLAYGYTVVDAPRIPIATAVSLAQKSQLTIIVFQLSIKDIRYARILQDGLRAGGLTDEHVMLLVNRHRSRHAFITLEEAKRCLGATSITCIENDYKSALRGSDYGKPLAEIAPKSAIRKGMRRLAQSIIDSHSRIINPAEATGK